MKSENQIIVRRCKQPVKIDKPFQSLLTFGIMFTVGTVDVMSTEYRPSIGRYFVDAPLTEYRSYVGGISVNCRSTVGGISVNYRSHISRMSYVSANYWPIHRSSIGQVSANYRRSVGQVSAKCLRGIGDLKAISADIHID